MDELDKNIRSGIGDDGEDDTLLCMDMDEPMPDAAAIPPEQPADKAERKTTGTKRQRAKKTAKDAAAAPPNAEEPVRKTKRRRTTRSQRDRVTTAMQESSPAAKSWEESEPLAAEFVTPPAALDLTLSGQIRNKASTNAETMPQPTAEPVEEKETKKPKKKTKQTKAGTSSRRKTRTKKRDTSTRTRRTRSKPQKKSRKKTPERENVVQPNVPKTCMTMEVMRDAARATLPPESSERVMAVHNISSLQIGPTREEKKATLVSMATGPGVPIDQLDTPSSASTADTDTTTTPTSAEEQTTKPKKKKQTRRRRKPPVVHKLAELPPRETWEPQTPTEKQAETGEMLPFVREIGKHPGGYKTAAVGVAIPAPGELQSTLRQAVDSSILSRHSPTTVTEDSSPTTTTTTTTTTTSPATCVPERIETEAQGSLRRAAAVAADMDARRMSLAVEGSDRAVRPLAELQQVFSDQNRLSPSDARTQVVRHLSGVIRMKVLAIDTAAKIVSSEILHKQGALDRPGDADPRIGVNDAAIVRNSEKGAPRELILDETEEDVLRALVDPVHLENARNPTAAHQVPLAQQANKTTSSEDKKRAMQNLLPRVGLGQFLDEPLDEAEVMLTCCGSLPDGALYFMSFDDTVAACHRVTEALSKLAQLPAALDTLRRSVVSQHIADREYDDMVTRLHAFQQQLEQEWSNLNRQQQPQQEEEDGDQPQNSGTETSSANSHNQKAQLWVRLKSVQTLVAILTGQMDDNRSHTLRAMVTLEEMAQKNLYRGPILRCFQDDPRLGEGRVTDPANFQHGWADRDVVTLMSSLLYKFNSIEAWIKQRARRQGAGAATTGDQDHDMPDAAADQDDDDDDDDDDLIRLRAFLESGKMSLPDPGTPADMAYDDNFLRPPNPYDPLERPCVRGERSCIGWILSVRDVWPATGPLNRAAHGFLPREYHSPDQLAQIQASGTLPRTRKLCLICITFIRTYYWIQMRLLEARSVLGLIDKESLRKRMYLALLVVYGHCNAIEPDHGYTEEDMLPILKPTNAAFREICQPMLAFRANAFTHGEVTLSKGNNAPLGSSSSAAGSSTGNDKATTITLPCFHYRRVVDFQ